MSDRNVIAELVAGGLPQEEAAAATERVFAAILAALRAGKGVSIPEVGRLVAPQKTFLIPGHRGKMARQQRKVGLRHSGLVEKGEPYEVLQWKYES